MLPSVRSTSPLDLKIPFSLFASRSRDMALAPVTSSTSTCSYGVFSALDTTVASCFSPYKRWIPALILARSLGSEKSGNCSSSYSYQGTLFAFLAFLRKISRTNRFCTMTRSPSIEHRHNDSSCRIATSDNFKMSDLIARRCSWAKNSFIIRLFSSTIFAHFSSACFPKTHYTFLPSVSCTHHTINKQQCVFPRMKGGLHLWFSE